MEKYIFLDIDGVIATPESVKDGLWGLVKEKQNLLGKILSDTNSKIILSSSWRKHNVEETIKFMDQEGFLFSDKIIGVTIRAYHYIEKKGIHLSLPRGVEIKQWIDTNVHSENGKNYSRKKLGTDYQYLILDDDNDMLLEHKDNFIRTDSEIGLTENNVKESIIILNKWVELAI